MSQYNSPNFNKNTGRFQRPAEVSHNSSAYSSNDFFLKYLFRKADFREKVGFSVIKRSRSELQSFRDNVMWVGHSCLLINYQKLTILTDPHFSQRASPFTFMGPKRVTLPPFSLCDLPKLDIVVISHNHYDHLDEFTIRRISASQPHVRFLVPLGLKSLLQRWGAKLITELDWWQSSQIQKITIYPTPVKHWSKRTLLDLNKSLWAGWILNWNDFTFYFAGDTGYSDDFIKLAKRFKKIDLAAIPIGAYEPRDFMKSAHVNPEEAVKIFTDLRAKYAIGIHWGTFKLTLEPLDEPPLRLKMALLSAKISANRFRTLKHGEVWSAPFKK